MRPRSGKSQGKMVPRFLREQAGDGPRGDGDSHECPYWGSRGSLHELYASPCCNSSRATIRSLPVRFSMSWGKESFLAELSMAIVHVRRLCSRGGQAATALADRRVRRNISLAPQIAGPRRILQGSQETGYVAGRQMASHGDTALVFGSTSPSTSPRLSSLCWPRVPNIHYGTTSRRITSGNAFLTG